MKNIILTLIILATAAICWATLPPTSLKIINPNEVIEFYLNNKEDYPPDFCETAFFACYTKINAGEDKEKLLPIAAELFEKTNIRFAICNANLYLCGASVYKELGNFNKMFKCYEKFYKKSQNLEDLMTLISESVDRGNFSYLERYKNHIMEIPKYRFNTKPENINLFRYIAYKKFKSWSDKSPVAKEIAENLEHKLLNAKYDEKFANDCLVKLVMYFETGKKDEGEKYLNTEKPLLVRKEKEKWEANKKNKTIDINLKSNL